MGCVDEHGAIRHRYVELCPINAIALLLWATFHLKQVPVPNFVPDFSDDKFGEFGRRDWYRQLLFFSSTGSPCEQLKYKSKSPH